VPLVVVECRYHADGHYSHEVMPVVALVQQIRDGWGKEGVEDPDSEPALHNEEEFEKAGYEYLGRRCQSGVLFVDEGQLTGNAWGCRGRWQVTDRQRDLLWGSWSQLRLRKPVRAVPRCHGTRGAVSLPQFDTPL
jgi:hypothetical protein